MRDFCGLKNVIVNDIFKHFLYLSQKGRTKFSSDFLDKTVCMLCEAK